MAGNPTFDAIVTSTLRKYHRKLQENLMGHNALFWLLKSRGYVDERKGGRSIVQPLLYGQNTTVRSYSGYDLLDVTPQEGISAAEYNWKYVAGSVTISGKEEFENSGKERIFSLLEAKIKQLELSMQLELNSQLFADGTGNSSKDITGLDIAVEDGTAWSTYGGIDRSDSTNSWWRNQWFNFDTVFGASSTFDQAYQTTTTKGMAAFRKMYNNCSIGKAKPDLIVTTQDVFEAYEGNVEGDKLRVMSTKLADAGFRTLQFKGSDIVFDEDMQSEEVLFLNSEFLRFVIGSGRNFVSSPFVKPNNQDAKVSQVLFAGNLTVLKSDQLGRITALSVS
jgi:hypothetical protein